MYGKAAFTPLKRQAQGHTSTTVPATPSDKILDAINHVAHQFGIPPELLYAQVKQESNFDPNAVSPCGAKGLMQIMPETGYELGLKRDEFFDIQKNLSVGARYLKRQFRAIKAIIADSVEYDDIWKLALAAYNGGLGYILRAITLAKQVHGKITWDSVAEMLADRRCVVRGKWPDHKQITEYVSKIWKTYQERTKQMLDNDEYI